MNSGQNLFSQLIDHLPRHEFRQCVERYAGNYRVRSFSCWDQFLSMMFAQLSYHESLRDIAAVCALSNAGFTIWASAARFPAVRLPMPTSRVIGGSMATLHKH